MNKEYKKLCPFKGWVLENFPFIETDFDAITNYELLCKIVEYLNKTSSQFNDMIDNINYLNNWFENLDLQDEVNNKLDEMAVSGQLQEIIGEYLNSKALWCFDNVANMKTATNLIDGSFARTLGYYEKNDGGSSLYKIRNITNDDIVDNMQIIALNKDNLIAEYIIINNTISPEQMGAYGDNEHDDSNILNSILNIASNKKYKIIGNKEYKINNPLNITYNNLDIYLNLINYSGVENAIYLKGKDNNIKLNKLISNGVGIYITCDSETTNTRNTINIDIINSTSHGIYFFTNSWGIYENNINFKHIIVSNNTNYGIYLKSDTSDTHNTSYINQTIIYGGRIDGSLYGIYADGSNGQINELLCYNISCEGCVNGIYLNKITDSTFENFRLEELTNEAGHLYMKLVGDTRANHFTFNRFVPLDMVDRTELTNTQSAENVIYSNIRDTRTGSKPLGSLLYFYGTDVLRFINPLFNSKSISGNTTLTEYEFPTFFNVSASVTNATLELNKSYNDNGINKFYIYLRSGSSLTIYNHDHSYGTTITDVGCTEVLMAGSFIKIN